MSDKNVLPTIWFAPDDLWAIISEVLWRLDPPSPTGRPRINQRTAFDAIVFRFRSGCQWDHMPKDYGDSASVHRTFQRWVDKGVLVPLWGEIVSKCDDLKGVKWDFQAADGWLGKARMGGDKRGRNPTDRGKQGTKKSVLVDEQGGPLGLVIDGANVHDCKLLERTINAIVVPRPDPQVRPQTLILDKGYDNPTGREAVADSGYIPEIAKIGEEKRDDTGEKTKPARRYVVERTLSWLSKCRGLLVRYEKKAKNYLGYLQIACALIWFRILAKLAT